MTATAGLHDPQTLYRNWEREQMALAPPDREGTDWEALGATSAEIREFALGGLNRRLASIGAPL